MKFLNVPTQRKFFQTIEFFVGTTMSILCTNLCFSNENPPPPLFLTINYLDVPNSKFDCLDSILVIKMFVLRI